jgi:hypothetical protein
MEKLRIYLDTSVIGGCFDEEFSEESLKLFECIRVGIYKGLVSSTTFGELKGAPPNVRAVLDDFDSEQIEQLPDDPRVPMLAAAYIAALALLPSCEDDATHIAFATVYEADALISWNFKHIVNLRRIEEFNKVNIREGYGRIEIHSPKDLIYGKEEEGI